MIILQHYESPTLVVEFYSAPDLICTSQGAANEDYEDVDFGWEE